MIKLTEAHLHEMYKNVTRKEGLLDFIERAKDPKTRETFTQRDLGALFSGSLWEEKKQKSGHRKFEHLVTHIVVEYKNHDNKGGIDKGAVVSLAEQIQHHIALLEKGVFAQTKDPWTTQPNYKTLLASLK